jgi:hypothetical protein
MRANCYFSCSSNVHDQLSNWFTLHYLVCGGLLSSINLIRPASSLMQLVFTITVYTSNGVVLMAASWIAVLGGGSIGSIYIVLMCYQLVVAYILYWHGLLVQSIGGPHWCRNGGCILDCYPIGGSWLFYYLTKSNWKDLII